MAGEIRDGRSTRWDPHRRARRRAIIEAAIGAIEANGPGVLTAQIAEAANVPRTHVYRHFDGKRSLDLAVANEVGRRLLDAIRVGLATVGTPREIVHASVAAHLGWIEAHPNLYAFLALNAYTVNATGERTIDDGHAIVAGELNTVLSVFLGTLADVDPLTVERLSVVIVGMVDSTAAWWQHVHQPPIDELTNELSEQVWLMIDRVLHLHNVELDVTTPLSLLGPSAE